MSLGPCAPRDGGRSPGLPPRAFPSDRESLNLANVGSDLVFSQETGR